MSIFIDYRDGKKPQTKKYILYLLVNFPLSGGQQIPLEREFDSPEKALSYWDKSEGPYFEDLGYARTAQYRIRMNYVVGVRVEEIMVES